METLGCGCGGCRSFLGCRYGCGRRQIAACHPRCSCSALASGCLALVIGVSLTRRTSIIFCSLAQTQSRSWLGLVNINWSTTWDWIISVRGTPDVDLRIRMIYVGIGAGAFGSRGTMQHLNTIVWLEPLLLDLLLFKLLDTSIEMRWEKNSAHYCFLCYVTCELPGPGQLKLNFDDPVQASSGRDRAGSVVRGQTCRPTETDHVILFGPMGFRQSYLAYGRVSLGY